PMDEDDFLLEAMAEDLAVRRQAIVEALEEARPAEPEAPVAELTDAPAETPSEALALAERAADLRARSAGVTVSTVPEWLRTQAALADAEAVAAAVEARTGDPEAASLKAEEQELRQAAAAALGPEAAVAVSDIGLERLEGLLRKHHAATAPPPPPPPPPPSIV